MFQQLENIRRILLHRYGFRIDIYDETSFLVYQRVKKLLLR